MSYPIETNSSQNEPAISGVADEAILAIDHGTARIGLAVKPAGGHVVLPLAVLEVGGKKEGIDEIRKIISEREITLVVVGLPLNADPEQMQIVKRFTRRLRKGVRGVRWRFADETLSSHAAENPELPVAIQTKKKAVDDRAAAIILETYLQNLS